VNAAERKRITTLLSTWRDDPVLFAREALSADPWGWQAEALAALATNDFLSIRSAHGVGKSAFLSWATLWYLTTRFPVKILCTAPTGHQLSDVLWAEIALWMSRMNPVFRDQFTLNTEKISVKGAESNSFAVARTARKENPDAFQGMHCLAEDHEILTRRGWLGIDEISTSDEVLSVKGEVSSWQPVKNVYRYPYVGHLNVFDGRMMSFAVTDKHRFLTRPLLAEEKPFEVTPLSEMPENNAIKRVSFFEGEDFEVPAAFSEKGMDAVRFAEFIGFWIGDGGTRVHHRTGRFYEVLLYQSKQDQKEWIESHLLKGIKYSITKDGYSVSSRGMCEWLMENVGRFQADRRIPDILKNSKKDVLNGLCDGLWRSDGTTKGGKRAGFYSTSKILMDDIQEVLIKLGVPATVTVNREAGSLMKLPCGGGYSTNTNTCYVLSWINRPTDSRLVKKHIKRVPYSGRVWCISTPDETFYTRRNGRVFVSGNSENLLLIADEASGIHDAIYEAGEGTISTPGAKMIMTGNPTRRTGYFFDSFHKQRDYWWRKKVSAFDMEGAPYYNPEYAGRIESRYGKDSNIYRVRVLGEFPIENDDSVIPYWHVEAATKRDVEPIENIRPVWGLDVARFGDCKTALAKRQGNVQLEPIKTWKKRDTMEVAGLIAREYEETPLDMQPSEIMVDAIGVGAGVVDRLREMGLPARGINVGEAASGRKDMGRLRDELWWRCREWFEQQDCKILDDEELIGQLTSIGYDTESSGKIKVWSKERLRKEGRESPDVADAWVLTFAGIKHRYNVESLDSYRTRMRKRAAHRGGRNWLTR